MVVVVSVLLYAPRDKAQTRPGRAVKARRQISISESALSGPAAHPLRLECTTLSEPPQRTSLHAASQGWCHTFLLVLTRRIKSSPFLGELVDNCIFPGEIRSTLPVLVSQQPPPCLLRVRYKYCVFPGQNSKHLRASTESCSPSLLQTFLSHYSSPCLNLAFCGQLQKSTQSIERLAPSQA